MSLFRLSLSLMRRDWRAGEWRVLLLALVLAVGSLATVGLFADRVRQALQQQAQSLIGADLRITSTRPFPPAYRELAQAHGLRVVRSLTFPSMVAHGGQVLLGEILAVETGYPLRGTLELDPPARGGAEGSIPVRGTVWVDARLLRRFDLRVGDEVGIGARQFRVAAHIVKDIDQSLGFASFAPRILMNEADLAATGLLQEGSRISWRLMFAGKTEPLQAVKAALQQRLSGNEKLEDVRDARPEIRLALERAEHFLGLAALTAAILAGVALALASRHFVSRHLDGCAVMRCLGARQNQVLRLFLYQFLLLGLAAAVLGAVLGYFAQAVLVQSLAAMRDADLPSPGWLPLLKAVASGWALLFGFAFLPWLPLRQVSPLRVLRRELGAPEPSGGLLYGLALGVLGLLFLWHAGSLKLGLTVFGVLLAGGLLFGWLAWWLLHGLAHYAEWLPVPWWRYAANNLARHGRSAAVTGVALGLGGMALLVLTLVRADLMAGWQGKLPPEAPNRFLVNIQSDQLSAVRDFFTRHSLPPVEFQPMVRGRLVAINERAISGDSYPDLRARGLVEREFNLSWMERMPSWNTLSGGRWWPRAGEAGGPSRKELSVEEGIARTLNIRLGDTLTYDVAGSRFSACVTSLRKVQWDSMQVNFFVIATPDLLQEFPASYLSSFYLPPGRAGVGDELSREFTNLLVIDTGAVIAQVRGIMDQIAQAVSAVFLFALFSGLAVLYAAMLATQDERREEAALLRTLGADRRFLRRLHLAEFAMLGALSGLFAATGATLSGYVLARHVLEIPYQPGVQVWLVGIGGGMLLVTLAGGWMMRHVTRLPPLRVLQSR